MHTMKKTLAGAGALFLILFLARFTYILNAEEERSFLPQDSFEFSRKNYASEKQQAVSAKDAAMLASQKYEMVATVSARSSRFEEDEKKLRATVQEFKGVVQFEQNSGLPGRRVLHMAIGVHPDKFDAVIAAVRATGQLASININKTDKTNDYKTLHAERVSLEKYRAGLLALKGRQGKIEELISLEQKILEIEKKIQDTGVQLGEFDQENEFCTIKISLHEDRSASRSIGQKAFEAFEWAVLWSIGLAVFYLFCAAGLLISLRLLDRLKTLAEKLKSQLAK